MFASAFPLFRLTPEGAVVEASAAAEALVPLGRSVVAYAEDGSRDRVRLALSRADTHPTEVGIRLAGTGYRLLLQPAGDAYHIDAVLTPVMERRPTSVLEAYAERTPVCLAHLDAQGVVTFESRRARQLLGYSSLGDAFLSSDPDLDRAVDALLSGGGSFNALPFTTEVRGHRVPLLAYGSPVRDEAGAIIGAVVVALAPVSADGKPALSRADTDHGAFISTVTHEVRNPLGVVNGFASMLDEELREFAAAVGAEIPPPVAEFVETIQQNARRALDILADISDLAKLEAGALTVRQEPVQLCELVRRVGQAFVPQKDGPWTLTLEIPESPVAVTGDSHRIEQILNALLASAAGAADEALLCLRVEGGHAEVCVEAGGWGPRAEALTAASEDVSGRYQRAGRGLAIAKGLAEAMGGTLVYDAHHDAAQAFTLTLPDVREG